MVKLTAELIEQAAQYTNAVRDRELDLRGELDGARAVFRPRRVAAGNQPRRVRRGWSLARGPPPGLGASDPPSRRALWGCLLPAFRLANTAPRFLPRTVLTRHCPAHRAALTVGGLGK